MHKILLALVLALSCFTAAQAADLALPPAKTQGGPDVLSALKNRASAPGNAFPSGAVSKEELATLLWAASGLNRGQRGWTVPMAQGTDPYCSVFVVGAEGVFRYDWKNHALNSISTENVKENIGGQPFTKAAPYILVFVEDGDKLKRFGAERAASFGSVLIGAMTQNVYLAAQSMGVGVRYAATHDPVLVRKHLKLKDSEKSVCIMPIGHQ